MFGFLSSCSGFPEMVNAVDNSLYGFAVTVCPDALGFSDSSATCEQELLSQVCRVFRFPVITVTDAGDDLLLVLVPFIHCPKCSALGAGAKPNPVPSVLSLQPLREAVRAIIEIEGVG